MSIVVKILNAKNEVKVVKILPQQRIVLHPDEKIEIPDSLHLKVVKSGKDIVLYDEQGRNYIIDGSEGHIEISPSTDGVNGHNLIQYETVGVPEISSTSQIASQTGILNQLEGGLHSIASSVGHSFTSLFSGYGGLGFFGGTAAVLGGGFALVNALSDKMGPMLWSVSTADIHESDGRVAFTITRSGDLSYRATIDFATIGGTAVANSDYIPVQDKIVFEVGETSKVVWVTILDNTLFESDKNIIGIISNQALGTIQVGSASSVILDDDQTHWGLASETINEGDGHINFVITRTGDLSGTATIDFATTGGTATAGLDYTAVTQSVTFADGETTKTIAINVTDDPFFESTETITGSISNTSQGSITTTTATGSIMDNDALSWTVLAMNYAGESAGAQIIYSVSRLGDLSQQATIDFATVGGSATPDVDYVSVNQTLNFAAGESTKTIYVDIISDSLAEATETVNVAISHQSSGLINTVGTTGRLYDSPQMTWSVSSGSMSEENGNKLIYTITRSGDLSQAASVDFTTTGGSASSGVDYTAVSQTVNFAAGETSKQVLVDIINDSLAEPNETVMGYLSNASSGILDVSSATATILDNDQSVWSISGLQSVYEGNSTQLAYVVTRTGDVTQAATIQILTTGGVAVSGVDYTQLQQTLSFAAGETSKTILVDITTDILPEPNESVYVSIYNPSTGILDNINSSGTLITGNIPLNILDDDQPIWSVSTLASVVEGANVRMGFLVSRTGDVSQASTVDIATAGGTAIAGVDYNPLSQTLSFSAGELSKVVWVDILNDTIPEITKTISLAISNVGLGTIASSVATGTLYDNDQSIWTVGASSVSVSNVDETAGNSLLFTVSRIGDLSQAATIDYITSGGTSSSGVDFTAVSQTLTFAAGESTKTVAVNISGDFFLEPNETVSLGILNQSSGTITSNIASQTILDNDQMVWSITTAYSTNTSVIESGQNYLTFAVTRTGNLSQVATIDFATIGSTAISNVDFTAVVQTLTFNTGESSKLVVVPVLNDNLLEPNETMQASIGNASAGTISNSSVAQTILDNNQSSWSISSLSSADEDGGNRIGFAISRTGNPSASASIDFSTGGGTATAGVDYTPLQQTLNFASGETVKTIWINLISDANLEPNESIIGLISNPSVGNIITGNSSPTIFDNDQSIWAVAAANTSITSVDETAGNKLLFTVSRTGNINQSATIDFLTLGGTASAGVDYTSTYQSLNFAAGESTKLVWVDILNDIAPETNETVFVAISNASTGTIISPNSSQIILDNDQSVWTVAAMANAIEETSNRLGFAITRSGDYSTSATIDFVANGSSTAMPGADFMVHQQTLNFAIGETSKVIWVDILSDVLPEPSETIYGVIKNQSVGTIATAATIHTIFDDDLSAWSVSSMGSADEDGGNKIGFLVSRIGEYNQAATINFATIGGTATAGTDFTPVSQILNFAAGETNKLVWVDLLPDSAPEPDETLMVAISNPSSGYISTTSTVATIFENDQSVWTITSIASVDENTGGKIGYIISRTGSQAPAATINFATSGGTATPGVDYTPVLQNLSFESGETSKVVWVNLIDDTIGETNESLLATISNPSSGTIQTINSSGTLIVGAVSTSILDNDQSIWAIASVTAPIESNSSEIAYTISRRGDISQAATIEFLTAGGSAIPGVDYTSIFQILSFAAGEALKTITISIMDDNLRELNESVVGNIRNPSIGYIETVNNSGTLLENDQTQWAVSTTNLSNALIDESSGNRLAFNVTRSGDYSQAATIEFLTAGGTASAGVDYTAVSQILNFAAGEITKVVWVNLLGDSNSEINESVFVVIKNASSGTIVTANASQTILDNDQAIWTVGSAHPSISSSDEEGNKLAFVVSRSGKIDSSATIYFSTTGGTATEGTDYDAVNQMLSFASGETSKIVWVNLIGNSLPEPNITVQVNISGASEGTITTASAVQTILDNDQSLWSVGILSNASEDGSNLLGFTVSRTGDYSQSATINFATAGGTATSGVDYTDSQQTLSFAAGEISKTVWVSILGDTIKEQNETVIAVISNSSVGSISVGSATQTIIENDQPVWSIAGIASPDESNGNRIAYTITRAGDISQLATVDFTTGGGTATPGLDYTPFQQTLTFASGEVTKVVTVDILGDSLPEVNENFYGIISNVSTGTILTGAASATITENDQSIWNIGILSNSDEGGSNRLGFSITRTGDYTQSATINFATTSGTATADVDYTVFQSILSFGAGEASKVVWVDILDDALAETNESVVGTIFNASTGTIVTSGITQTIIDNEQSIWSIANIGASEEDGNARIGFSISRGGNYGQAATIDFSAISNSASADFDYTPLFQTLNFAAGETVKNVFINVTADTISEPHEIILGVLSNASSGLILVTNAAQNILDNDQSIWSISTVSNTDEDGGNRVSYVVSRTGSYSQAATIDFMTIGGSANGENDYTPVATTLGFAAGEFTKIVNVNLTADTNPELDESIYAILTNASSGTISTASSVVNILNNDQSLWRITVANPTESNSGKGYFIVSRSGDYSQAATINFQTAGGNATAGVDYTPVNTTLNFAAGETTKTVLIDILDDALPELNETVFGIIKDASAGAILTGATTMSILDNDESIWAVSILNSNYVTSDESSNNKVFFIVSRSGDYSQAATIDFMTAGGTATAGLDYTAVQQTLSFAAGENLKTIAVNLIGDSLFEVNETISVLISNASAGTILTISAVQTVMDNEQPIWSIANVLATTDESASNKLAVTISRTGDYSQVATIDFKTAGGTATAGLDYTPVQQTLNFAAGEITKTVYVDILGDSLLELNETVIFTIGNASAGTIATSNTAQTILDNDLVLWAIASGSNPDEDGGNRLYWNVTRTGDISQAATIDFVTLGGTAIGGLDYTPLTQTLNFAAGETAKIVSISALGDSSFELNEAVTGGLSNASVGTIVTSVANQTILDNDQVIWSVSAAVNADEDGGNRVAFNITRSGEYNSAATIDFATAGGTAIAGLDYTALQQTLSFRAGEITKTVYISLSGDTLPEVNETIAGVIGNSSIGTISTSNAAITIFDNDLSTWAVAVIAASDEDGGNRIAYSITRSGNFSQVASIQFATIGGTATGGVDYTSVNTTLNFAAGETIKTVWVDIAPDSLGEANETIIAGIGNASSGTIITSTATGTITDNDFSRASFAVSVASNNVYESTGSLGFIITRSGDLSSSQTISYSMGTGTATSGVDFTAISGTLTFNQGETTRLVMVPLLNDSAIESSETIILQLTNASAGTISTASATATILDDDSVAATSYAVAVTSNSVYESTGSLGYTITRSGDVSGTATTYFRTNGGTATAGTDYTAITSQALNWRAGEVTKVVFVTLLNDAAAESSETIIGQIATDSGFTIGSSTVTATILDDDSVAATAYAVAVTTNNIIESTGALAFTITRSGDISAATTTYFRTNGGTAQVDGSDYTLIASQTLNWAVGETTKLVFVNLTNDSVTEGNETIIGQIATNSGFTTGLSTATATVLDDDIYLATSGVADALTTGTVSGAYRGGYILSTGDMNDTVTIGNGQQPITNIDLGSGDDVLNANTTPASLLVVGSHYQGGSGVDTLSFLGTTAWNFSGTASSGDMVKGFEVLSLSGAGNQILNISLQDVLEFTAGNSVQNTIKITGNAGDVLNLQVAGKALQTIAAAGTVTDVDTATYSAVGSSLGNGSANDVTISGQVYDIYQYNTLSGTMTLLIDTDILVNTF